MSDAPLSPWFTTIRPATSRTCLRLFCAPYAGGSTTSYRSWNDRLPPEIALYAIELPGRGSRFGEPCITRMDELVGHLASAIRPALDLPFVLFGHSLGAVVMFELARRLESLSGNPDFRLILSGQRAFHRPAPRPPIHDLSDARFMAEVTRFGGTPHGLFDDPELRSVFLPLLRADFTLGETYVFDEGQPLAVDLCAYGGLEDEEVSVTDVKQWNRYTNGQFTYRMFPGNHFFLHQHEDLFLENLIADLPAFSSKTVR